MTTPDIDLLALQRELEALERTDPGVAAAGASYDAMVARALGCRYCRHPLTDDQERRWGICGSCHDDGTTP